MRQTRRRIARRARAAACAPPCAGARGVRTAGAPAARRSSSGASRALADARAATAAARATPPPQACRRHACALEVLHLQTGDEADAGVHLLLAGTSLGHAWLRSRLPPPRPRRLRAGGCAALRLLPLRARAQDTGGARASRLTHRPNGTLVCKSTARPAAARQARRRGVRRGGAACCGRRGVRRRGGAAWRPEFACRWRHEPGGRAPRRPGALRRARGTQAEAASRGAAPRALGRRLCAARPQKPAILLTASPVGRRCRRRSSTCRRASPRAAAPRPARRC
jgi:hypothetical protein